MIRKLIAGELGAGQCRLAKSAKTKAPQGYAKGNYR
jgi:hypothetical protein